MRLYLTDDANAPTMARRYYRAAAEHNAKRQYQQAADAKAAADRYYRAAKREEERIAQTYRDDCRSRY